MAFSTLSLLGPLALRQILEAKKKKQARTPQVTRRPIVKQAPAQGGASPFDIDKIMMNQGQDGDTGGVGAFVDQSPLEAALAKRQSSVFNNPLFQFGINLMKAGGPSATPNNFLTALGGAAGATAKQQQDISKLDINTLIAMDKLRMAKAGLGLKQQKLLLDSKKKSTKTVNLRLPNGQHRIGIIDKQSGVPMIRDAKGNLTPAPIGSSIVTKVLQGGQKDVFGADKVTARKSIEAISTAETMNDSVRALIKRVKEKPWTVGMIAKGREAAGGVIGQLGDFVGSEWLQKLGRDIDADSTRTLVLARTLAGTIAKQIINQGVGIITKNDIERAEQISRATNNWSSGHQVITGLQVLLKMNERIVARHKQLLRKGVSVKPTLGKQPPKPAKSAIRRRAEKLIE